MKKICDSCGKIVSSKLLFDLPCFADGCNGTLIKATEAGAIPALPVATALAVTEPSHPAEVNVPVDNAVEDSDVVLVFHSGENVIARRRMPAKPQHILNFIHSRATDLDSLGAKSAGDLLRELIVALQKNFSI